MTTPTTSVGARKPVLMLGLATVGFALNFWAWALLSPLGTYFKDSLDLTRFPPGTARGRPGDRRLARPHPGRCAHQPGWGRIMFPAISFATIAPLMFLGYLSYLTRPYILYRSRETTRAGTRPARRGWQPVVTPGKPDRGAR